MPVDVPPSAGRQEVLKLPQPSIRKLFREDFAGRQPIQVDRAKLPDESKHWESLLRQIEGVHVTRHPGDKDSRSRTLCRFTIPDEQSDGDYWRSDELRLEYDDEGRLTIQSYQRRSRCHAALVSDVDEIRTFVRHVRQRYNRRHAAAKKREKVRQFKSKAIIAQVKKLAKDESFDFATIQDSVKIRLFVKLSPRDMVEISVPFKQFEKVLPKLRATIESLRELYKEGLRFKVSPVGHLPWNAQWVEHRSLD
jgi:hypothetical protein